MTSICFVCDDCYEIQCYLDGTITIVRYRHGFNSEGEEVDFDSLPPRHQDIIFNKLRDDLKRRSNSRHDDSNSP